MNKKKFFGILIIAIFLLISAWSIYSYSQEGFVFDLFEGNTENITQNLNQKMTLAILIFFFLIVLECVFAPFPPLILYIVGGAIFGGFIAGSVATIANIFGAMIAFQISKNYGREWVERKVPKKLKIKFDKFSIKYGPISIFFLRLNPITSSDLFSYIAGLTKMNFKKFVIYTILGLIPTIYLQTYLGGLIQQSPLITQLSIIGGALYLIGFFIIYFWIKKKTN